MTASPQDVTSDMALIEKHWREGLRLQRDGAFTLEEWSRHQAISYSGLLVLGVDGMQQLARTCLLECVAEQAQSAITLD